MPGTPVKSFQATCPTCLAFLGLRIDQVEILSNVPLLAPSLTGVP